MLRNKQEELSEMNVRKEMAEKKLSNLARENEVATEKLTVIIQDIVICLIFFSNVNLVLLFFFQRKLEDNQLLLKRKEKEFNETLEHLQSDMETLEKEKAELKEKLMQSSKKVLLEGLTKTATTPVAPFVFSSHSVPPSSSTTTETATSASAVRDSPLLLNKISHLREALRQSQAEKARLLGDDLRKKFEALPPLRLPKKNVPVSAETAEVNRLIKEAAELKMVMIKLC